MSRQLFVGCLVLMVLCGTFTLTGCGGSSGGGDYANSPTPKPPQTAENVKQMLDMLTNANAGTNIRRVAAVTLGEIGDVAKTALPELEAAAANDPDESVRKAATEAIAKIKGGAAPAPAAS